MIDSNLTADDYTPTFYTNRQEWLQERVPDLFRNTTLENYVARSADQHNAIGVVKQYRWALLSGQAKPLYLFGPPGTGKSELASALWNSYAPGIPDRADYRAVVKVGTSDNTAFINGSQIPDLVKNDRDNHGFEHLCTCDFAVIDDLDKCPAGWSAAVYQLIERRTANSLPTVITANATPKALARQYKDGDAIVNRLERYHGVFIRLSQKPTVVEAQGDQPEAPHQHGPSTFHHAPEPVAGPPATPETAATSDEPRIDIAEANDFDDIEMDETDPDADVNEDDPCDAVTDDGWEPIETDADLNADIEFEDSFSSDSDNKNCMPWPKSNLTPEEQEAEIQAVWEGAEWAAAEEAEIEALYEALAANAADEQES